MKTKTGIVVVFISLITGCSSLPKLGECQVDYPYDAIDVTHLPLPQPIMLQSISGIDADKGRICVSTDGMSDVIQWQHEVDRFNRDLREWWKNVLQSIADQNSANQGALTDE